VVGARLHKSARGGGTRVGLVGRGRHLDAVRRRGLRLDGETVRLPAFSTLREAADALGPPDRVILTVKAYDVEAAAGELAGVLGDAPSPVVLCLQNGLGSEETVARQLPLAQVMAGAITLSLTRPEPGRLAVLTEHGGIALAPFGAASADPGLVDALRRAGFRVRVTGRADAVKWSKVLLNLWANATCAAFGVPPETVVSDRALFHLDWAAFREALRVMRALGVPVIDLPGYPVRLLALLALVLPEEVFRRLVGPKVSGGRGGKLPSFLLDLRAGKGRSEVDYLNGAVAAAGRRVGVETPVNKALTTAVAAVTAARRAAAVRVDTDGG
jgi:2-dehydropantoate 2-reductase